MTTWQDLVLALCGLAFVPSMALTLVGDDKPALATSITNALLVMAIAATQATLGLWLSVTTSCLIAGVWTVLAIQKAKLQSHGTQTIHPGQIEMFR